VNAHHPYRATSIIDRFAPGDAQQIAGYAEGEFVQHRASLNSTGGAAGDLNFGGAIPRHGSREFQVVSGGRGYVLYTCETRRAHLGVVTLVRLSGRGDMDFNVAPRIQPISYTQVDPVGRIAANTETEDSPSVSMYLPEGSANVNYVHFYRASNEPGYFRVYCHDVDIWTHIKNAAIQAGLQTLAESFFEALIEEMLGISHSNNSVASENISRAIGLGFAALQRDNITAIGVDAMINEVSIQVSREFPNNRLVVNFATALFSNIIQDVYVHAFRAYSR